MKLVSRETLEALLKNSVSEGEDTSFSYEEFLRLYRKAIDKFAKDPTQNRRTLFSSTYEFLKETYLKQKCPPIAFCGEGSSRGAYAILGGKCLKIAMNERGIAQNKQEVQNMQNGDGLLCFAKLYEYDENGGSLLTECCCEAKEMDFQKAYNCPNTGELYDVIYELIQWKGSYKKTKEYLLKRYQNIEATQGGSMDYQEQLNIAQWKIECLENIEKSQAIQWRILRDLISFYEQYGHGELDVGDLANEANWGMAIREGEIVPVIIDAGLSENVYSEYYA